jgi:hypothetical protein
MKEKSIKICLPNGFLGQKKVKKLITKTKRFSNEVLGIP